MSGEGEGRSFFLEETGGGRSGGEFREGTIKCHHICYTLRGWDLKSDIACCDFPYPEEGFGFELRLDRRRVLSWRQDEANDPLNDVHVVWGGWYSKCNTGLGLMLEWFCRWRILSRKARSKV